MRERSTFRFSRHGKPTVRQARIEVTISGPQMDSEYKSRSVEIDRDESAASILDALIGELTKL